MIWSAIVAELVAAGVTGDALVTAIGRIEAANAPAKTAAAQRQARYRERAKAKAESVTGDACDVTRDATPSPSLPPLVPPLPPAPPSPPIIPPNTPPTPARKAVDALPDWLPADAWLGYSDMRRKIKKPMTDRAKQLAIGTLAKLKQEGFDPAAVLDQSVMNGWQGLFPPKQPNRPFAIADGGGDDPRCT